VAYLPFAVLRTRCLLECSNPLLQYIRHGVYLSGFNLVIQHNEKLDNSCSVLGNVDGSSGSALYYLIQHEEHT
jgi:hypothetical protein